MRGDERGEDVGIARHGDVRAEGELAGVGCEGREAAGELRGVRDVAIVAEGEVAGGGRTERGLGVLPDTCPRGRVARVANRDVAAQRLKARLGEHLRYQAHVLEDDDVTAIAHRDAGRLLASVLEGIEAEVGELRDVVAGSPDAEHPAGILRPPLAGHEFVR